MLTSWCGLLEDDAARLVSREPGNHDGERVGRGLEHGTLKVGGKKAKPA